MDCMGYASFNTACDRITGTTGLRVVSLARSAVTVRAAFLSALLLCLLAPSPGHCRDEIVSRRADQFFGQWLGHYMVPIVLDITPDGMAHVYVPGDASLNTWYTWKFVGADKTMYLYNKKTGKLRIKLLLYKQKGADEIGLYYDEIGGMNAVFVRRGPTSRRADPAPPTGSSLAQKLKAAADARYFQQQEQGREEMDAYTIVPYKNMYFGITWGNAGAHLYDVYAVWEYVNGKWLFVFDGVPGRTGPTMDRLWASHRFSKTMRKRLMDPRPTPFPQP